MKKRWQGVLVAETERIALLVPDGSFAKWARDYAVRNREYHRAAMPVPPFDYDTSVFWKKRLKARSLAFREGLEYGFFILPAGDPGGEILGDITFSQVFHGALSAAVLGYKLDRASEGKGLMHEALGAALSFMFSGVKLHRIEANVVPQNIRSFRLLRRLGFVVEGYSRRYLKLDNEWRDHVRLAKFNPSNEGNDTRSLDLKLLGIEMPSDPSEIVGAVR